MILIFLLLLSSCTMVDQLENVGKEPQFTPFDPSNKYAKEEMKGAPEMQSTHQSLWSPGKRSFFKDQRAHQVGDLLIVVINTTGKADISNKTTRSRDSTTKVDPVNFFGIQGKSLAHGAKFGTHPDFTGEGEIHRGETINVRISATVSGVLPNGNLVISGHQEMRVNFEIREIFISGIVRHQDISDQNEITWDKIAEARMGYGGRGQISQFQQPPYGQQILDIVSPF